MASIGLSQGLRAEYKRLWETCTIKPEHSLEVEEIAFSVLMLKGRYEALTEPLKIPWFFVGLIHHMESDADFTRHFHNGDLLTARTVNVPYSRPKEGEPPFTWEESAVDALNYQRLSAWHDWGMDGLLDRLEAWHGFGYRIYHPWTLSPYLWSFSNHYAKGKYGSDGIWDDDLVSKQCGAAVILRQLVDVGSVEIQQQET